MLRNHFVSERKKRLVYLRQTPKVNENTTYEKICTTLSNRLIPFTLRYHSPYPFLFFLQIYTSFFEIKKILRTVLSHYVRNTKNKLIRVDLVSCQPSFSLSLYILQSILGRLYFVIRIRTRYYTWR